MASAKNNGENFPRFFFVSHFILCQSDETLSLRFFLRCTITAHNNPTNGTRRYMISKSFANIRTEIYEQQQQQNHTLEIYLRRVSNFSAFFFFILIFDFPVCFLFYNCVNRRSLIVWCHRTKKTK